VETFICPFLGDITSKLIQGECVKGEVFDKPSIVVGEPQERLEFLFLGRDWPISKHLHFEWIHFYRVVRDYDSKEIDLWLLEFAFFDAEEKVFVSTVF
jgi:hypothetical protein